MQAQGVRVAKGHTALATLATKSRCGCPADNSVGQLPDKERDKMDLLGFALVFPFALGALLAWLGVDFTDKSFYADKESEVR
jgi:hypothetical protein